MEGQDRSERRDRRCPYCREETLTESVGNTGTEKALSLLQRARELTPDTEADLLDEIDLCISEYSARVTQDQSPDDNEGRG